MSSDIDALIAKVEHLKVALGTSSTAPSSNLLAALTELKTLGILPEYVLGKTKIGVLVGRVAKDVASSEEVRTRAQSLLDEWKQAYRKRKASVGINSDSPPGKKFELEPSNAHEFAEPTSSNAADSKLTPQRAKVLQKLREAIGCESELAIGSLIADIESALHTQLGEKEYLSQARSVIFNLKNKGTGTLCDRLKLGIVTPELLPTMTAELLASDAQHAERTKAREESLKQSSIKEEEQRATDAYTCEKCKGKRCTYVNVTPVACVNGEHSWTNVTCLTCGNKWKA